MDQGWIETIIGLKIDETVHTTKLLDHCCCFEKGELERQVKDDEAFVRHLCWFYHVESEPHLAYYRQRMQEHKIE